MAPTTATPFKGAIRYQKKQDMIQIAEALGLKLDPATHTRDALEDIITRDLRARRNELSAVPLFEKLYDSLDRDDRKENGDSESDGSPETTAKSPRKVAGRKSAAASSSATPNGLATPTPAQVAATASAATSAASTAVKDTASDASAAVKRTSLGARSSFENLKSRVIGTSQQAQAEVHQAAADAQRHGNALLKKFEKQYRAYEKRAKKTFTKVQLYASNVKHITAALLLLELVVLLLAVTPLHTFEFGPSRLQVLRGSLPGSKGTNALLAKAPRFAFSLPHPKLLVSVAFWQPLLIWGFFTFAIPFVASHIVTFDRGLTPSVFTFNFTRLIILLYLAYVVPRSALSSTVGTLGVAAGQPLSAAGKTGRVVTGRSFASYDYVLDVLPAEFSVVLAAVATGFTVHETIVHRAR